MIPWILFGVSFLISCAALTYIVWSNRPRGPIIPLDSACPACGNFGCTLKFDGEKKKVARICRHCGCSVTQPPVMSELFEKKT